MDIRQEIANKRAERIKKEGYGLSIKVPKTREVPLNDFYKGPYVICEVKRGSPSKGGFAKDLDAVGQATHYKDSGVKHISVLTEEDRFLGSLQDLIDIKKACPDVAVLRKDFLLDLKDIEVSFLCGADAFLLIASLLDKELLEMMYKRGEQLGMTPLVEVHDKDDVDKVRDLKPKLTGINSRNLKTFTIDSFRPLKIRSYIDWDTNVIYESGIKESSDAVFARDAGFSGILVGEWAVKDRTLAKSLVDLYKQDAKKSPWKKLYENYSDSKPFIKVCGITNREDAIKAAELGADMLGFILATSPRETSIDFIKSIKDINKPLKVGVVVLKKGIKLSSDIKALISDGYLDFIQFHGEETSEYCKSSGVPYYKALRIKDLESLNNVQEYSGVCLLDSFSKDAHGGTGKRISDELTTEARKFANLWLAGGLNPDNVKEIVNKYRPELIDVSSGIEISPGKKDFSKMEKYFKELK
ncbi:MAG: bifunctional indole-3-glycerol phosphate synthase/phosphoribosylanthranilate isomerase [Spirochaetaceae bacterium]